MSGEAVTLKIELKGDSLNANYSPPLRDGATDDLKNRFFHAVVVTLLCPHAQFDTTCDEGVSYRPCATLFTRAERACAPLSARLLNVPRDPWSVLLGEPPPSVWPVDVFPPRSATAVTVLASTQRLDVLASAPCRSLSNGDEKCWICP